jgi:hypothetical protein
VKAPNQKVEPDGPTLWQLVPSALRGLKTGEPRRNELDDSGDGEDQGRRDDLQLGYCCFFFLPLSLAIGLGM